MDQKEIAALEAIRKNGELQYWVMDFVDGTVIPSRATNCHTIHQIIRKALMIHQGLVKGPFVRLVGFAAVTNKPYCSYVLTRHVDVNDSPDSNPICVSHFNDLETTTCESLAMDLLRQEFYCKKLEGKPAMELNSAYGEYVTLAQAFTISEQYTTPSFMAAWERLYKAVIDAHKNAR